MSGSVFSVMLNGTQQNQGGGAESGDISEDGGSLTRRFGFEGGGRKSTAILFVCPQTTRTCSMSF